MTTDEEFQQEKLIPNAGNGIYKITTYDQFQAIGERLEAHLSERRDVRGSARHGVTVRSIVSQISQFQASSPLPSLVSFRLHKLIFTYYLKSKKQTNARLLSIPDNPTEITDFYKDLRRSGKLDDPYWLKSFFVSFAPALRILASQELFVEMVDGDREAISLLWGLDEPRIAHALAQCYFKFENGKATGISELFSPPQGVSLKGAETLLSCRFNTDSLDEKFLRTAPDFLSMVSPDLWVESAINFVVRHFPFNDLDSRGLKNHIASLCTDPDAMRSDVDRREPLHIWLRTGAELPDNESMALIDQINADPQLTQLVVMIALPSGPNSTGLNRNWKLLTDNPYTKDSFLRLANLSNGGLDGDYIASKIPFIYKEAHPPLDLALLYERKSKLSSVQVDQVKHERFALRLLRENNVAFIRAAMENSLNGDNYDFCKPYFKAYIVERGLDDYAKVFASLVPVDFLNKIAEEIPCVMRWISNDILQRYGRFEPGMIPFKKIVTAEIDGDVLESWALIRESDGDMRSLLSLIVMNDPERNVPLQPATDIGLNFGLDF